MSVKLLKAGQHTCMGRLAEGDAPSADLSRLSRPCMLVYVGEFESMDGPVTITEEHLDLLIRNHNSRLERLKRALGLDKVPIKDSPPLQLDHSTSAAVTVGRVPGKLFKQPWTNPNTGLTTMALFTDDVTVLGRENVEKVADGRWAQVSIGADLEAGKLNELSITPFPAADCASMLATSQQATAIKSILSNDESSTDKELEEHFVNEIGISREEAKRWIAKRSQYLNRLKKRLASYKGVEYELVPAEKGTDIYVGGQKVTTHEGSDDDVRREAEKYIDKTKETGMHEKLKKHLMESRKMSDEDADKLSKDMLKHHMAKMNKDEAAMTAHMAEADDAECKRLADEHDEEQKRLAAEQKDEEEKKLAAKTSFIKLAKGIKSETGTMRMALRKSAVSARLARFRSEGRVTPAELKNLDVAKLAALSDEACTAALATFEAREPVIQFGLMHGTTKGEEIAAVQKRYRLARMELESRLNMPSKRKEAEGKLALLVEQEKQDIAKLSTGDKDAPSKGMLTKVALEDLYGMLDDKKRHDELRGHLKHLMDHYGMAPEGSDTEMSALAKRQTELQNQLDELITLASPALGIQNEELK